MNTVGNSDRLNRESSKQGLTLLGNADCGHCGTKFPRKNLVPDQNLGEEKDMSNYTQEELQGLSRVQLRRAAMEVLKIDNKEASNTKSGDLIERILDAGEGAGGNGTKKAATSSKKRASKATAKKRTAAKEETTTAAPSTNGVGKLVDAVGKAVDETKEELSTKIDEMMENQDHIMKQQFILFGLLVDVYKAVDEPDALEARLEELEEEWNAQGN